jgi:ATP-dependent helicase/nuclease subunit B
MPIKRRFLGWDRPVLELVAEALLAGAIPPILDLSHLLVIVPTRNAGRRLREMLAHLAAAEGRAICPPHVVPPDFLLSRISSPASGRTASPVEALLAWVPVLRELPMEEFPALFPVPPAAQDFAWALTTGRGLSGLRDELGEAGLSIQDVASLLAGTMEEEERWDDLARLEQCYTETLNASGLADLLSVRQSRAQDPEPLPGISGIWIAGCPDPIPLALEVLKSFAHDLPVEILVHAPESAAGEFDDWGRPRPEAWQKRIVSFPGGTFPVHVLPNPEAQAELAAATILSYPDPAASISAGVLDEEVTPALERILKASNQRIFNPGGSSLRAHGGAHLLKVLRDLLEEGSVHDFIELLRCPEFDAYLKSCSLLWDGPAARRQLDADYRSHLFQDLRGLRFFLKRKPPGELLTALDEAERLLAQLQQGTFAVALPAILEGLYGSRPAGKDEAVDRAYRALADAAQPVLDALSGPLGQGLTPTPSEAFALLIEAVEQETIYEERPAGSVELLGWLELHWDDAPHLIVTGFNEGFAPEAVTGDVFLPEMLRKLIAAQRPFPTNETRLARDTYLFEALLQSRRSEGRVDLCLGKHRQGGDPARPSRLLFLCEDEELPARVDRLFRSSPPPSTDLPWTPGFQLHPYPGDPAPPPYAPVSLPVTAFRTYLTSPFDFYLRHVEGMRPIDGELREMDAATYGTFCHEVLRRFGADAEIRESTAPRAIQAFFEATIGDVCDLWFGRHLHLPVRIQVESIQRRLAGVAEIQAQSRSEGWRIEATEVEMTGPNLTIAGVQITGRIDRIDRHESSGALRILDYKTSDRATAPKLGHQAKVSAKTRLAWLPSYAIFEDGRARLRWKDLQLPLYRHWLSLSRDVPISCGYFQIPKAITETAIDLWPELGAVHDDAALHCAAGIIESIRSGLFWPAPASSEDDDFSRLHLGLPDKTIAFSALQPESTP